MVIALKLLAPLVLLVINLVALAVQQKWHHWHDQRRKIYKRVMTGLIGLMVLLWILTSVIVWTDARSVEQKTDQIIRLSESNAKLSQSISDTITGGDSFCYFFYGFAGETFRKQNRVTRILTHRGEQPLRELNISILDVQKLAWQRIYKPMFFTPKRGPGQTMFDWIALPEDQDLRSFEIFYSALNGAWKEQVSLRRVGEKWQVAILVRTNDEKTVLHEQVDPNFPRDADGNVMW